MQQEKRIRDRQPEKAISPSQSGHLKKLQLQDLQLQKKKNVTDQNKVPRSHTAYTKPQNC